MLLHTRPVLSLHDVHMIDAVIHDGCRWLGYLLCPSLEEDSGEQACFNLLTREKVRFWKLKKTEENNHYPVNPWRGYQSQLPYQQSLQSGIMLKKTAQVVGV